MAKPSTILVKLVSTADTGYFYVAKRNPRKKPEKLSLRKFDPVVRKHVPFKEEKMR
ncbi:MAG: 50S ribosomal protein L33 [Alphaproteobacteria bacterium]